MKSSFTAAYTVTTMIVVSEVQSDEADHNGTNEDCGQSEGEMKITHRVHVATHDANS